MARVLLLFFSLLSLFAYAHSTEPFCFFRPPKGWQRGEFPKSCRQVRVLFALPKSEGFQPSIGLAVEPVHVSLSEYLKKVREIHEKEKGSQWRALGKVHTAAGQAQLTQIDSPSEWGLVRMLQLILVKEEAVYVVTAAALKEEFSQFYKPFQEAFRSLTLTEDLFQVVDQMERRERLKEKREGVLALAEGGVLEALLKKAVWKEFAKEVDEASSELGSHWQFLALKEAQEEFLHRGGTMQPQKL